MIRSYDNIKTVEGTQIKLGISLFLPGELTMDEVDFTASFYIYPERARVFEKSGMSRVNENLYTVTVDTAAMGVGEIQSQFEVILPDGRREKFKKNTNVFIASGMH
jgi:hypothetical protein